MSGAAPKRAPCSIDEAERFEKGCLGKLHFTSYSGAHAALKDLLKHEHVHRAHAMHVYECEFCPGEWVYGHAAKKR